MPALNGLVNAWKNIREIDLSSFREEATQPLRIALVGIPGVGRHTLADQMRLDPARPQQASQTPVSIVDLATPQPDIQAHLIILMLDANAGDFSQEKALARKLSEAGQRILVFVNKMDLVADVKAVHDRINWPIDRILYGSATSISFLKEQFVPAMIELLTDKGLALSRNYPLFREEIANRLINDTCFSNAAYAISTGIAEIVPVLDLPLNITDMFVLSKTQAFLVYKLGLALGYSTRWQDYVTEFGSVIGSGFLWRQIARELVGLIPVWGIVPKTAVAYAGTYVVGHTVLTWYKTGRKVTAKQVQEMYVQAFKRGKTLAESLASKVHPPRLAWRRKKTELPPPAQTKTCPSCGKQNSLDAAFCEYCGAGLEVSS